MVEFRGGEDTGALVEFFGVDTGTLVFSMAGELLGEDAGTMVSLMTVEVLGADTGTMVSLMAVELLGVDTGTMVALMAVELLGVELLGNDAGARLHPQVLCKQVHCIPDNPSIPR